MIDGDAIDEAGALDDPLLPGEMADSHLAEDAEHWVAVYEELSEFLDQVDRPDETVERYRRRLAYWRCRRDDLAGGSGRNGHSGAVG